MLEQIDLTKKMGKKEFHIQIENLSVKLAQMQRECKSLEISVMQKKRFRERQQTSKKQ